MSDDEDGENEDFAIPPSVSIPQEKIVLTGTKVVRIQKDTYVLCFSTENHAKISCVGFYLY